MQKGVHELKETQKGIELMCHEMEKIYSAGMESGEKRGELKTQKETVLFMAEEGMDVKQIVRLVKVTEKEVQKWIDIIEGRVYLDLPFFPNYEITPTENFLKMHIIIYYQQHRIILTKVEEYGLKTRITKNWDFFE